MTDIRPAEIRAAASRAHDAPNALAALVFDVLSRQAEGRALLKGKAHVEARRKHHGVEDGVLGETDVLALLGRGPTKGSEYALLMALAVQGLAAHVQDEPRIRRFLRHADWLAFSTPYPAYEVIEPVLGEQASALWVVLKKTLETTPSTAKEFAAHAMRQAALAAAEHAPRSENADEDAIPSLSGRLETPPAEGFGAVLRLVSGWAVLVWALRGFLFLLRHRNDAELSVERAGLRLTSERYLLGKKIRSRDEVFSYDSLVSAGRTSRLPAAPLVLGMLLFGVGVLVGGLWLFEGVRSGETVLLLAGAGLIVLGGGLDLAINTFWPMRNTQQAFDFAFMGRRRMRLTHVGWAALKDFDQALTERIERTDSA